MQYREQAIVFACESEELIGIICGPGDGVAASDIGVVVVVGGPQHRVGSHRQFVLLGRALAARGHHCLRFDYRGMGDSTGPARSFEEVSNDIHAAVQALQARCPEVSRIALWGLCDGASASLLYLQTFATRALAHGLCLVNPWVRSADSLAKTQVKHYYARRLVQKEFWAKLLRGDTGLRAAREFAANLRAATKRGFAAGGSQPSYQERMAAAWQAFPGRMLLLLSGDDYVAMEFLDHARAAPAWAGLLSRPALERRDLPGVDHTFSTALWCGQAEELTAHWLAHEFKGETATFVSPH